ncbi:unnamed protein product [Lactuca saligna]|uniref:Reverse transcriptase zinc-binding domain-containing protein n=1 Tax=Lactuca saligna TaxID=75948 RepID=A0AA35V0R4_LACSI|nr:unnamed protein product [Lactuca saligna]
MENFSSYDEDDGDTDEDNDEEYISDTVPMDDNDVGLEEGEFRIPEVDIVKESIDATNEDDQGNGNDIHGDCQKSSIGMEVHDDALFIGEWSRRNIANLARILRPLMMKVNIDPKEIVSWNSDSRCWESEFMIDNRFSVSLIRDCFEMAGHIVYDRPFDWNKMIPFKILCFIWRAKQGRIPSAVELKSRGITIPSTMCISCKQEEETSDHMLITCQSVRTVMNKILN